MSTGAQLVLAEGAGVVGQTWPVLAGTTSIGRSVDCDIVLADREVSRFHAQVRHEGERYVLVDLGSKNGTYLNGVRVSHAVPLADGDEVRIAPRFRLVFADADATVAAHDPGHGISIDVARRGVRVAGRLVDPPLARQQFALLQLLASEPGRVFSREEVTAACYPDARAGVSDQAVDGVVRRLRARLTALDPDPGTRYVFVVRGHGFRLHG